MDYVDVREMMVRVGMLGRYKKSTAEYVEAEFEYTVEGQLGIGPDDRYCLHPLFVRTFRSKDTVEASADVKPVYPRGTPLSGRAATND